MALVDGLHWQWTHQTNPFIGPPADHLHALKALQALQGASEPSFIIWTSSEAPWQPENRAGVTSGDLKMGTVGSE